MMRTVKKINVNLDNCIGCRACEMACSAFHATPRYSSVNPAKSRIKVVFDELKDLYLPVRAGDYTSAECLGRNVYNIDGKEYPECSFCNFVCPSRGQFMDPDSGLPLMCDMCESDPPVQEPLCVKVCRFDALVYEEIQVGDGVELAQRRDDLEAGIENLVDRFGLQKVLEEFSKANRKR